MLWRVAVTLFATVIGSGVAANITVAGRLALMLPIHLIVDVP